MMPCGCLTRLRRAASVVSAMPRLVRSSLPACLSSSRSTTRSPCAVGRMETRTSTERPAIRSAMRPSWGWRFSAMSRRAMILMRDTITPCTTCGGSSTSRSMPSLRKRTTERRSKASMWMSDAPSRTAWENSALMRRTMGASSSLSSRSATLGRFSASAARSAFPSRSVMMSAACDAPRSYARASAASKASLASSRKASRPPSARCTSASTLARTPGRTHSSMPSSSCRALITPWRLAKAYGSRSTQRASAESASDDMSMRLLRRGRGSRLRLGLSGGRRQRRRSRRRGARRRRRRRTRLHRLLAIVDALALGALAARVAAQVVVAVDRHPVAVLGRADDHRPQEDHQVGALALLALEAEQRSEEGNLAQPRNALHSFVQGVLDQPAEHDGAAVVHDDLGLDRALVGDEVGRTTRYSRSDVRDLLEDLQAHRRAFGNLRLDAQGDAHVLALDRLKGIHRSGRRRGDGCRGGETAGDEGHVLADDDFRLVVVEGEQGGRGENAAELVRRERTRERADAPHRASVGKRDGLAEHRQRQAP